MDFVVYVGGSVRSPLVELSERDRERTERYIDELDAAGLLE